MLTLFDTLLLFLATLRLSRLVMRDSIGQWYIIGPVSRWLDRVPAGQPKTFRRRARLASGLTCPFCIGFWLGTALVLSTLVTGGLGDEPVWWRVITACLALNYVVGHVAGRMGDTDPNAPF